MKRISVRMLIALLLIITMISSAGACKTAYYDWTWGNIASEDDLSVQCYSADFEEDVSDVAYDWNGISAVFVSDVTWDKNVTAGNVANINIHETELTGTTIGLTRLYKWTVYGKYSETEIETTGIISQARIYLDPSLLDDTVRWRQKTILHELGHAFALKHPILDGCTVECVMQQNSSGYAKTTIQAHDENNMRNKWGA